VPLRVRKQLICRVVRHDRGGVLLVMQKVEGSNPFSCSLSRRPALQAFFVRAVGRCVCVAAD
jgi:hypothetical protein